MKYYSLDSAADVRPVASFSMVYKDVFNLEYLYKNLLWWLQEEGYKEVGKWQEKLYLERVGPTGAKEHWIWWRVKKKTGPYYEWFLNVDIHTLFLEKTEVMHEGKKVKSNKGEIEIFFNAKMVIDSKGEWKNHWLLKHDFIQKLWKLRMMKSEIEEQEDLLYKDVYRLQNMLKQYLGLKGFIHEYTGEPFTPVKGH